MMKRKYLAGLGLIVFAVLGVGSVVSRVTYVPPEPLAISRHFIDLVQAGDFASAYNLTDHGRAVGASPAAFEANIRHQMDISSVPASRPVEMQGLRSGAQSYGNRLRRWVMGRKLDPDEVDVDYAVGGLPFDIRLVASGGEWRVVFFQSHAA